MAPIVLVKTQQFQPYRQYQAGQGAAALTYRQGKGKGRALPGAGRFRPDLSAVGLYRVFFMV